MHHPLSNRPGRSRQFPPRLQLRQILFLLILDVSKCGLQLLGILIQVILRFFLQLPVYFPPVLGVGGLMWFAFPIGYITLNEIQPYFAIPPNDLG